MKCTISSLLFLDFICIFIARRTLEIMSHFIEKLIVLIPTKLSSVRRAELRYPAWKQSVNNCLRSCEIGRNHSTRNDRNAKITDAVFWIYSVHTFRVHLSNNNWTESIKLSIIRHAVTFPPKPSSSLFVNTYFLLIVMQPTLHEFFASKMLKIFSSSNVFSFSGFAGWLNWVQGYMLALGLSFCD